MSIADGWKSRLRKVAALLFSSPPHATSLIYGSAEIQDITDRKRADQALRGREAMFHPVADTIQEIFWMVDAITKQAIYVNPSFEQVTGGTIAGLMNAPLSYRELSLQTTVHTFLSRLDEAQRTVCSTSSFESSGRKGTSGG